MNKTQTIVFDSTLTRKNHHDCIPLAWLTPIIALYLFALGWIQAEQIEPRLWLEPIQISQVATQLARLSFVLLLALFTYKWLRHRALFVLTLRDPAQRQDLYLTSILPLVLSICLTRFTSSAAFILFLSGLTLLGFFLFHEIRDHLQIAQKRSWQRTYQSIRILIAGGFLAAIAGNVSSFPMVGKGLWIIFALLFVGGLIAQRIEKKRAAVDTVAKSHTTELPPFTVMIISSAAWSWIEIDGNLLFANILIGLSFASALHYILGIRQRLSRTFSLQHWNILLGSELLLLATLAIANRSEDLYLNLGIGWLAITTLLGWKLFSSTWRSARQKQLCAEVQIPSK
jgi:hypothetical protein